MRVAVAGGGIAGLTSAIALAQRGFSVDLFERAPNLEEIGAGIQLSPNATAVLDRLGVTRDLEGRFCEPEALAVRSARQGALLAQLPLGRAARRRYGSPYITLHRADLQAGLLAAVRREPQIALHHAAEVHDVRATDTGAVFTAGGRGRRADVLVAADGIRSRARTGYFRHPGPTSLGRTAWRGTMSAAEAAGQVPLDLIGLWLGAGGHLVHYPIANGASLNVVVIAAGDAPAPPKEPFGPMARRIIDAVPRWAATPLAGVDPARAWVRGRVALVGDAAHAMAPSAAQGGAQAIEDAWILAASLAADASDPVRALATYEHTRRRRVERVVRNSNRNLKLYELGGVPAVIRNFVLGALPTSILVRQLDWLFGWRPE